MSKNARCGRCGREIKELTPNGYYLRGKFYPASICCNSYWTDNCSGWEAFLKVAFNKKEHRLEYQLSDPGDEER